MNEQKDSRLTVKRHFKIGPFSWFEGDEVEKIIDTKARGCAKPCGCVEPDSFRVGDYKRLAVALKTAVEELSQ